MARLHTFAFTPPRDLSEIVGYDWRILERGVGVVANGRIAKRGPYEFTWTAEDGRFCTAEIRTVAQINSVIVRSGPTRLQFESGTEAWEGSPDVPEVSSLKGPTLS